MRRRRRHCRQDKVLRHLGVIYSYSNGRESMSRSSSGLESNDADIAMGSPARHGEAGADDAGIGEVMGMANGEGLTDDWRNAWSRRK